MVAGALKNQTKRSLNMFNSKKWVGHIAKNYPNPLTSTSAFAQSALTSKDVKAAVAYGGKNRAGVECGWLLAWADTKATGRRIYGECGPRSKFNNVNWDHIEKKLNVAGASGQ